MKKIKKLAAAGCCGLAILTAGTGLTAMAAAGTITVGESSVTQQTEKAPDYIPAWGTIKSIDEYGIVIDNLSGLSSLGEMVIQIDPDQTLVLDAVNGFPVAKGQLKAGDFIYAYLGPVMTMSLPPRVTAEMIICQAPADFKVPEYVTITGVVNQADGSAMVTGNNGNTYTVPADCQILPYLTRNMVTMDDVQTGRKAMIWSDQDQTAAKIVLFQPNL